MDVVEILKKGVPTERTQEANRDLGFLRQYYFEKTGKRIPCGWCNRAALVKACKKLAGV